MSLVPGDGSRQVEADGGPPKQFVKAIGALEDYIEPPGVSVNPTTICRAETRCSVEIGKLLERGCDRPLEYDEFSFRSPVT